MSKTQVNGVGTSSSSSTTIDHLVSYPLVSDLFKFYKSLPLGAKSVELSHNIYLQIGKPVITSPLVQNPYSYVYPYAKKVDELGDNTLSQIDANFPAIKETDLESLKSRASSAIIFPFRIANEGKDYVLNTYSDEYNKNGGQGLVSAGKAIITTELRIAAEALQKVGDWVGPRKDQAEATFGKAINKFNQAKDVGSGYLDQARAAGSQYLGQAKDVGNEKANQAKEVGNEKVNQAKDAGNKAKDVGNEKASQAKKTAVDKKNEVAH